MKTSNLATSNSLNKKVVKSVEKKYRSGNTLLSLPLSSNIHTNLNTNLNTSPIQYKYYSPKVRQQVVSNKLLNSQLYELYTVRKLHCVGKWLKANIVDGTIKIAKQTYVISWLDILPIDAFKEEEVVVSLRTPKYKDKNTKEYALSYAVVSRFVE